MTGREPRPGEPQASPPASQAAYWTSLYEQCHRQLRAYFARNVRCPHDAEDLVQEVFAGLILRGGRLQEPMAYVRAVARHELRAYWRRKGRKNLVFERAGFARHDGLVPEGMYCDRDSNPLIQLGKKEIQETVASMINALPPASAEILRLRYINGMDPEEAASRTGCSQEAIKKRLTRAKQSLAKLYGSRPNGQAIAPDDVFAHGSHYLFMP